MVVNAHVVRDAVNHIALPYRLPGEADQQIGKIEQFLTEYFLVSIQNLTSSLLPHQYFQAFDQIRILLQDAAQLNAGEEGLNKEQLLQQLRANNPDLFTICFLREQNAGLIIRKATV